MSKNLVIVESPAKAKTIEKFLGKDYHVLSSFGHIRDLPKRNLSIDIEHGFTPEYEIQPDKKALITQLSKAAKEADFVWLASDEDREGEAIAWHLDQVLKLDPAKTKRIVFNEITKTAILHAIENPRQLDYDLVNAQQARRVLDRLVGYEISPLLWKKVRPSLSAGRVTRWPTARYKRPPFARRKAAFYVAEGKLRRRERRPPARGGGRGGFLRKLCTQYHRRSIQRGYICN